MTNEEEWDNCCCGCCIGLGIGYLLWHNNVEKANEPVYNHIKEVFSIENIVKPRRQTNNFLLDQIENYQTNIRPKIQEKIGNKKICRYEPSCSEYAKQAIIEKGSVKGLLMTMNRLIRCNPLSKGGYDLVK